MRTSAISLDTLAQVNNYYDLGIPTSVIENMKKVNQAFNHLINLFFNNDSPATYSEIESFRFYKSYKIADRYEILLFPSSFLEFRKSSTLVARLRVKKPKSPQDQDILESDITCTDIFTFIPDPFPEVIKLPVERFLDGLFYDIDNFSTRGLEEIKLHPYVSQLIAPLNLDDILAAKSIDDLRDYLKTHVPAFKDLDSAIEHSLVLEYLHKIAPENFNLALSTFVNINKTDIPTTIEEYYEKIIEHLFFNPELITKNRKPTHRYHLSLSVDVIETYKHITSVVQKLKSLGLKISHVSESRLSEIEKLIRTEILHLQNIGYISTVYEYKNQRVIAVNTFFKTSAHDSYKEYSKGVPLANLPQLNHPLFDPESKFQLRSSSFRYDIHSEYYNYLDAGNLLISPYPSLDDAAFFGKYYADYDAHPIYDFTIVYGPLKNLPNSLPYCDYIPYSAYSGKPKLPVLTYPQYATVSELSVIYSRYLIECSKKVTTATNSTAVINKFLDKIKQLKSKPDGSSVKYNNIYFYKDAISYEGQTLKFKYLKPFLNGTTLTDYNVDWVSKLVSILFSSGSLAEVNFDLVIDCTFADFNYEFLKKSYDNAVCEIKIGDVKTTVVKKASKSGAFLHYLNGFKINKDEIINVLKQAMTYTDQKAWDNYIKNVSSCSLRFYEYTTKGIVLNIDDDILFNVSKKILIYLKRIKNLNYIKVDEKLYKIKDSNKFLTTLGENYNFNVKLSVLFDTLNNPLLVENFSIEKVAGFLKAGEQNYIQYEARQKALLTSLFDLTNSTYEKNVTVGDQQNLSGIKVKGKMSEYFIEFSYEDNSKEPKVYKYPSGDYVCIIDKTPGLNGWEKTFNRALALLNDKYLAQTIHTLN